MFLEHMVGKLPLSQLCTQSSWSSPNAAQFCKREKNMLQHELKHDLAEAAHADLALGDQEQTQQHPQDVCNTVAGGSFAEHGQHRRRRNWWQEQASGAIAHGCGACMRNSHTTPIELLRTDTHTLCTGGGLPG